MFEKIWAKYLDIKTNEIWQGILCLKIGQSLSEYETEHKIKVLEYDINI